MLNILVLHLPTIILHEVLAQSRFEKFKLLYLNALDIRERALGKEHPSIRAMLEHYTILLRKMNKEEKANE